MITVSSDSGAGGDPPPDDAASGRDAGPTAEERQDEETVDERFRSFMEGLRTSLPAVQVLFAFLLTAPLQSGFSDLATGERAAFSIAFYSSGLASVLLIAPSIHQRVRAPSTGIERHSERDLAWATWVAILGSIAMGVAMSATVYLVSAIVFGNDTASLATAAIAGVLAWAWFYLPLVTFNRSGSARRDDPAG